jgi:cytochrome c biogenesis protein CcmG/thiol:disulfide interchange protein DsbE
MSLRHRHVGRAAVGLAFVGLLAAFAAAGEDAVKREWREGEDRAEIDALEGKAPPELTLKDWTNGKEVALADLKGKVVLIDFWATWCGPCLAAVPHTNELQAKFKDKGLVVIAVCNSRGAETMAKVVADRKIEYLTAADVDGKTVEAYRVGSFPDYYLVDRAGKLRIADCRNDAVDAAVEALLAEPDPADAAASAQ